MVKPQKTEEPITISVHGKNIDLGDNFYANARNALQETAGKYFSGLVKGEVTISRVAGDQIRASISMHPAKRVIVRADAEGTDAYAVFTKAAGLAGDQLQARKEKISLRRKPAVAALKASAPDINANGIDGKLVLDFVEPDHSKAMEQQRLSAEVGIHDLGVQMRGRPGWKPENPWTGAEIDPTVSPVLAPFRSEAEKAWNSGDDSIAGGPTG